LVSDLVFRLVMFRLPPRLLLKESAPPPVIRPPDRSRTIRTVSEAAVVLELRNLAERRHSDPGAVRDRASAVLADPAPPPDALPVAEWVLGLALHELGEARRAVDHLRRAIRLADRGGDAETAALARAGLAISLLSLGRTASARAEIARADASAPPSARGRVDFLYGLVEQRVGRLDAALALYRRALPRLRRDGDDNNLARALLNRGTLLAYQGAGATALADFAEVERLAGGLGLPMLVAMAAHNAGFALGRQGDVAEALAAFDRAEVAYDELGGSRRHVPVLASDRCDVLLQVGLTADARDAAELAVAALEDVDVAHCAEARLLLAQACLAAGDLDRASAEAAAAAGAFRSARRRPWAALAGYVGMQAAVRASQDDAGAPGPELLTRALAAARELEAQGWPIEALHARTFVGRVALALGRPAAARRELTRAAAARGRGPAGLRAQAWHATALVRLADGDRPGAKRALRAGLRVLDTHTARLGATELRAGAAAHGQDLARLGLRLALADGRPWEVLRWAERWRAGALRLLPVRPPADPALAEALTELRSAESDLRAATLGGSPPADALRRVALLERKVRDRARRSAFDGGQERLPSKPERVVDQLAGRTLVELVSVESVLHAVVVTGGRARLHELGPVGPVDDAVQRLLFVLRRLLDPRRAGTATAADLDQAARRLDDLVLAPLPRVGDGEGAGHGAGDGVVVVPTHPLHRVPWGALPSLAGRPVTVAPSTALWQRGAPPAGPRTPVDPARVVLVAGPDLAAAGTEVATLAAGNPGARVLRGDDATVDRVVAAVAGADLVHVAAHGRFRSDGPLFSSFRLADGALTIYDLERVGTLPGSTFVLPVCDAAAPKVTVGDEVLGTAAALLGLGARSVLAPLLPVPDAATTPFVLAVHEALRSGLPAGAALVEARAAVPGAVADAFVCIGADT
jgi:tetratricopeptide (TPR) repeat protein